MRCTYPQCPSHGPACAELNRLDNAKGAKATDALLNYETVKYFGNEALERRNFADVSRGRARGCRVLGVAACAEQTEGRLPYL